jgi:sulfur relay (sulfurtransferase) complex TusBCD TusD component (DsrE family)
MIPAVAAMTEVHHHAQLFSIEDGVYGATILQISASKVASIIRH